jgi:hypothetical protein
MKLKVIMRKILMNLIVYLARMIVEDLKEKYLVIYVEKLVLN